MQLGSRTIDESLLALVIPARDEEMTIAGVISEFRTTAANLGYNVVVFVVDDHSQDGTVSRAREAGAHVLQPDQGSGLANAFNVGVQTALESAAGIIVHVDADAQYGAGNLQALLEASRTADLVLGNRLWRRPSGMSQFRYSWNQRLSTLTSELAAVQVMDSQTGFRVLSRRVAGAFQITSRFTYTQEQIIRSGRGEFIVHEVPISFEPRRSDVSRLARNPLEYLWRVFRDLDALTRELGLNPEEDIR